MLNWNHIQDGIIEIVWLEVNKRGDKYNKITFRWKFMNNDFIFVWHFFMEYVGDNNDRSIHKNFRPNWIIKIYYFRIIITFFFLKGQNSLLLTIVFKNGNYFENKL